MSGIEVYSDKDEIITFDLVIDEDTNDDSFEIKIETINMLIKNAYKRIRNGKCQRMKVILHTVISNED